MGPFPSTGWQKSLGELADSASAYALGKKGSSYGTTDSNGALPVDTPAERSTP